MSLLDDAFEAAADEVTPHIDVDVSLGGKHIPLRFYRLDGEKWAEITSMAPMRLGSVIDRRYGYNFQAASRLAAPESGRVIEDDVEVTYDDAKWDQLFKKLAGHSVKLIHSAIWQLNEYDPEVAVADAKKGSAGGSQPKPA